MKTNLLFLSALLSALPTLALGAEYYPKHMSIRTFGTDQGNVGDCETEADIGALENGFSTRGLSYVHLSLFYRHAANWSPAEADKQKGLKLEINASDLAAIQQAGPIVPEYMWPEDAEGYDPLHTGIRPHVSESLVYDPDFPSADTMGFSKTPYTFEPRYSNTRGFDDLKQNVAAGNAVTLAIHDQLFQQNDKIFWDHTTGLLSHPYSWADLMSVLAENKLNAQTGIDHAVVVVGFDDTLYSDQGYSTPGAFIVRNTWNDRDEVEAALVTPTDQQKIALAKMRLKLFSQNTPGFYAIPYQYILDSIANGVGSFKVLNLNYVAYASKYLEIGKRYQTVRVPYSCDELYIENTRFSARARRKVKNYGDALKVWSDHKSKTEDRATAANTMYQLSMDEVGRRTLFKTHFPTFNFAKVARNMTRNIDRAADFYDQKFVNYYCPAQNQNPTSSWPYAHDYKDPGFQAALVELANDDGSFDGWAEILDSLTALGADSEN